MLLCHVPCCRSEGSPMFKLYCNRSTYAIIVPQRIVAMGKKAPPPSPNLVSDIATLSVLGTSNWTYDVTWLLKEFRPVPLFCRPSRISSWLCLYAKVATFVDYSGKWKSLIHVSPWYFHASWRHRCCITMIGPHYNFESLTCLRGQCSYTVLVATIDLAVLKGVPPVAAEKQQSVTALP